MKTVTSIVLLFFLLFSVGNSVSAQSGSHLFRVQRFRRTIPFDAMQEWVLRISNFRDKHTEKTTVVIRLCTSVPILKAMKQSALQFPAIVEILEGGRFDPSDILILKSKSCIKTRQSRIVPAELWVTADISDLPSYDKKYTALERK